MSVISAAKTSVASTRQRLPFVDHLIRMYGRYQADAGDRLAAGVTFYWFLSLFPILLLAISALGFAYGDEAPAKVTDALSGYLPDQLVQTIGDTLQDAKGKAGVIGLAGLLLSGLGWIDGLREAIRSMWHQNVKSGNLVTRKLVDIVVLVGLFATIGASIVLAGATTAATGQVVDLLGLTDSTGAKVFTQVLAYGLSGAGDTLLFLYMFTRLPRVKWPLVKVFQAAVFGAVGFQVLKFAGAYYVARTTSKGEATYGTFAVVVGLLLFLNLVSRLIMLTAAFAVTAPYDSDVPPSGTASREMARKAGIPQEYADNDPDDPPALQDDGAPTPLVAAVQHQAPPQDEPVGRSWTSRRPPASAQATAPAAGVALLEHVDAGPLDAGPLDPGPLDPGPLDPGPLDPGPFDPVPAPAPAPSADGLPGEDTARLAGRVGSVALGVTLLAVAVYALRTLQQVLRRYT